MDETTASPSRERYSGEEPVARSRGAGVWARTFGIVSGVIPPIVPVVTSAGSRAAGPFPRTKLSSLKTHLLRRP